MSHTREAYEAYAILAERFGEHIVIEVPFGKPGRANAPDIFEKTVAGMNWAINIWIDGELQRYCEASDLAQARGFRYAKKSRRR